MVVEARLDRNDRTDAREMARRPQTVRERLGGPSPTASSCVVGRRTTNTFHPYTMNGPLVPVVYLSATHCNRVWMQPQPLWTSLASK
jgi:hypothetical protein